jgi:hypothetical protein
VRSRSSCRIGTACLEVHSAMLAFVMVVIIWRNVLRLYGYVELEMGRCFRRSLITCEANIDMIAHCAVITPVVCLFVFLALQPIVVVFSQPGSGL